ncbi:MAG: M1 family aminopeptidase [Sandaracinaceae bacterium]|nr:M1 family aminopeptidase [Sandaracinaceae bacterium]
MKGCPLLKGIGLWLLFGDLLWTSCGGAGLGIEEYGPRLERKVSPEEGMAMEGETQVPFRLPEEVYPTHYALELEIDPHEERFRGRARIRLTLEKRRSSIWIHGKALEVQSATARDREGQTTGKWSEVDTKEGMARIDFERSLTPGEVELEILYERPFEAGLDGVYRLEVGGEAYAFTQFEPISARKAFPCFDEPRFKTPFEVTIIHPSGLQAFANAPEVAFELLGDRVRRRFAETPPLPTYLVAWTVGVFDIKEGVIPPSKVRSAPIPLRGIAPRGSGDALAHALAHTPRILLALEDWFGIVYPYAKLDLVAVPDFAAGAMENPGLITFRAPYLLLGKQPSIREERAFALITAHELAHQWFGNLVTLKWWEDLWLNEAFATWMETQIVEATFPQFRASVLELLTLFEAFEADSQAEARIIRQPILSSDDIHNAFDDITYAKGASVLGMLSAYLGLENFRDAIRHYLNEHAHRNATSEDFIQALERKSSQKEVRKIIDEFTKQGGIPYVRIEGPTCDGGRARVLLKQERYRPLGSKAPMEGQWAFPSCFLGAAQDGVIFKECFVVTAEEQSIDLPACPAWIWPNPDGRTYARFALEPPWIEALKPVIKHAIEGAHPWKPGEKGGGPGVRDLLSLADGLEAGVFAGHGDPGQTMDLLEAMVRSDDRFVAMAGAPLYRFVTERLLEGDELYAFERRLQRLYRRHRDRFLRKQAAFSDDPELRSFRVALFSFLADIARDPRVRAYALAEARRILEKGEQAVHRDLWGFALGAYGREADEAGFEKILSAFAQATDEGLRFALLQALSQAESPALRERVLGLALDSRLRRNEVLRPIAAQAALRGGWEPTFEWMTRHFNAIAQALGREELAALPFAFASGCKKEQAQRLRSWFEGRLSESPGLPRNLALSVEAIELCAAQADALSGPIRNWLRQK